MREIKFRAWNGEMMMPQVAWIKRGWLPTEMTITEFGEVKWMQFTGLHDKNGKEIYEGDIVLCDWWGEKHEVITLPVEWFRAGFYVRGLTLNTMHKNTLEVIGNIYENPELLK